jgi:hypothetical protein
MILELLVDMGVLRESLFVIVSLPSLQFFTDVFNTRGLWLLVIQDEVFYFQLMVSVISLCFVFVVGGIE